MSKVSYAKVITFPFVRAKALDELKYMPGNTVDYAALPKRNCSSKIFQILSDNLLISGTIWLVT